MTVPGSEIYRRFAASVPSADAAAFLNYGFWPVTETLPHNARTDYSIFQRRLVERAVERVRARTSRPRSMLDVGCGRGGGMSVLGHMGDVVGVDPELANLRISARTSDMRLVVAVAGALPFAAARFDVVVVIEALHLVASLRDTLRDISRVARRDADIVVADYINPAVGLDELTLRRAVEDAGLVTDSVDDITDGVVRAMSLGRTAAVNFHARHGETDPLLHRELLDGFDRMRNALEAGVLRYLVWQLRMPA